jgi:RNA polymerase primary sigma factor
MVEGNPTGHQTGEIPLTPEHASLIVFAFEGTPYGAVAAEARGEAFGGIQDALWATINLHHAQRVASSSSQPDTGAELIMQGLLSGNANHEIVAGYAIATGSRPRPGAINRARVIVRGTFHAASERMVAHDPSASLPTYTKYVNSLSGELMGRTDYDMHVPLHQAIRFFANSSNPHQADTQRSGLEAMALLHHMSDDPNAPPAVLPSGALDSVLSNFRHRYREWLEQSGHSRTSEAFQMMDSLLEVTGQRELQSFRQLLGSNPCRAVELRALYMEHLNEMFMGFLEMPPVRQVEHKPPAPEKRTPAKEATKKAAAAAGLVAVDGSAVELDGAPAAPRKRAAKKAAPAKKAMSPGEQPRVVGVRRASDEEFNAAAAELFAKEIRAAAAADTDLGAARAAGAAGMQEVFDFGTPADRRKAAEEKITRDGTDIWVIAAETDVAYAPGQTGRAMSTDSVRAYLRAIGKTPLLNAAEEVEIAKAIEAGLFAGERVEAAERGEITIDIQGMRDLRWIQRSGERAKNLMLEANLRLVVSIAKRYTYKAGDMSFLDLIQEGNTGLIRAVEKFDYTKGYKFSTYATWWVRQAVSRAIADQARTIRIPVHMVEAINRMTTTRNALASKLGREPDDEELAKELDITSQKVQEMQTYAREPVSLDQKVGTDSDTELSGFVSDTKAEHEAYDSAAASGLRDQLNSILKHLTEKEAGVIRARFGLDDGYPKTLEEIAADWSVTRERIRQIEGKALAKLGKKAPKGLKDFLG